MKECLVCGNKRFQPIYAETLLKCAQCGFATANLDIDENTLKKIYTRDYFHGEEYLNYTKDKEIIQLNFEKRIRFIKKTIANRLPVSNCLEIGCAYGFFGEILKKHFIAGYTGIDVVPEAIQYGQQVFKLDVRLADYLALPAPEKAYSDVFMWDVIEHLQYPERFIQKIFDELAPGGRLYITTGDFSSFLSRVQGRHWRMIHPPTHLHYFSKSNLILLLGKMGFKIISATYQSIHRSLRQIFFSIFIFGKGKTAFIEQLKNKIPEHWSIRINTFDIVFIIAEKV
ncbi:MAG: class I SAM-dependent methyltransferase [Bacteroidales bacterium]|nr:class I SAM-dependent methyltransferase [Bacteroidales bacterium]